jgi:hypothetical protein
MRVLEARHSQGHEQIIACCDPVAGTNEMMLRLA